MTQPPQDEWVRTPAQQAAIAAPQTAGPIYIRAYPGKLGDATGAFQRDVAQMAQAGYHPVNQMYVPGSWSSGAYLLGLLLILAFGLGILILGYLIIVKPDGTLQVTYEFRANPATLVSPMPVSPMPAPMTFEQWARRLGPGPAREAVRQEMLSGQIDLAAHDTKQAAIDAMTFD